MASRIITGNRYQAKIRPVWQRSFSAQPARDMRAVLFQLLRRHSHCMAREQRCRGLPDGAGMDDQTDARDALIRSDSALYGNLRAAGLRAGCAFAIERCQCRIRRQLNGSS